MNDIIVGIDIGGSHLTAAITDLKAGRVVVESRNRGAVNSLGSSEDIIRQWSDTIRKTLNDHKGESVKIGVAMPGPFQYEAGISQIRNQNKYDALYGMNVKDLLAQAVDVPAANIRFVNDAECFLRGEAYYGAVRRFRFVLGLTLGTGLGTAWHRDGRTTDGDLWRFPFREGIAEDYCSTRWFIARYKELTGRDARDVRELSELSVNDAAARQTFVEFGENLGAFLEAVTQGNVPEAVVVGGNIARAFDLFYPSLRAALAKRGLSIEIFRTELGEEAALMGAASVWNMGVYENVL
jgi:glucokinase